MLRKGFGLLIVILVTSIMAGLAAISFRTAREQIFQAANFSQYFQALTLARAGVNLARAGLMLDDNDTDDLEEDWNLLSQASQISPIPLGNGYVSMKIIDEDRKKNINALSEEELLEFFAGLELKRSRKGDIIDIDIYDENINQELVDSFLDWTDPDDNERSEGAESIWYKRDDYVFMGEKIQYFPHNNKLATIGELLWIKGFTAAMLFGQKENPRVLDLITIYGSGKLNLNTVSAEMLKVILKREDEYSYQYVLEAILEERPFADVSQARDIIGRFLGWNTADRLLAKMKLKSEYFRIIATGMVGSTESVVEAIVKRTGKACDILLWLERTSQFSDQTEQRKEMVL